MDPDEYRERSRAIWEQMAAGWDRQREWMWHVSHPIGEQMVAKLDPQPGQTILELASGLGDTGFLAAYAIGESGKLISTDFSPQMVELARRHADELGLHNVEHRVMDAENMDLPDNSVDGVLCRWGYMLMADPGAALRETRRVLRDGGRLSFSVWGDPARNAWASIPRAVLGERGQMPSPEPGAPGIFAMADPSRVRELVTAGGFAEPELEEVEIEYRFSGADQYWHFLMELAGGIALVVKELPTDEQQAVRDQTAERIERFREGGGYRIPGVALNATTS